MPLEERGEGPSELDARGALDDNLDAGEKKKPASPVDERQPARKKRRSSSAAAERSASYRDRRRQEKQELDELRAEVERMRRSSSRDASPTAGNQRQVLDDEVEKAVNDAIENDEEVARILESFAPAGSPDELASTIATLCIPLAMLHECWDLSDDQGNPTAECKRLARGWYPLLKKHNAQQLAWLKKYRAELVAVATGFAFLKPRIAPTYRVISGQEKSRLQRVAEEMLREQQQQKPAGERVVDINSAKAASGGT